MPNDHEQVRLEVTARRAEFFADPRRLNALADYRRVYGVPSTQVMAQMSKHAILLVRAEAAVVGLISPSGMEWTGALHAAASSLPLAAGGTLAEWAAVAGRPLLFDDTTGMPAEFTDVEALGWRSAAAMPLMMHGVVVGVMLVGRTGGVPWGRRESEALSHWMALDAIISERRTSQPVGDGGDRTAELERLGLLFERAPIAWAVIDADGRFQSVNAACAALMELPANALTGRRLTQYVLSSPGDPTDGFLDDMLAGRRRGYTVERRLLRGDGEERRVRLTMAQVRYAVEGQPAHLAVFDDISAAPAAERTLRAREAQLRQAQRRDTLGQLAGGLAHEFSNELAAMTGLASLLYEDLAVGDPRRADAEELLRVAERASDLTNRMLELGQPQTRRRVTLDLCEMLQSFRNVARRLVPTPIEWRIELPDEAVLATIDRSQVEQALLGLVLNARDAMPDGGVLRLSLSTVTLDDGDGQSQRMARIAVGDTGAGLTAAEMSRVWTPFFTTKAGGTGLGLSLGLAVLSEHGGALRLESAEGESALFAAYLPLASEAAVVGPQDAFLAPIGRVVSDGRCVLLVEDERTVRFTTSRVLERGGFRVVAVEDGEEALRAFEAAPASFAAVVSDLQIPRIPGLELIRRIRALRPEVPIVVTSAHAADLDAALRAEFTLVLRKPFPMAALLQALNSLLLQNVLPAPDA